MRKEDIIKVLQANDSTVMSYPSRGPWGDNHYRGNCSGYVQAFLMWKYQVKKFAELFAGSGTGSDVARDMGVEYIGADLNPNPKRDNILTVNAITDEVPDEFYGADMIFMHPPYGAEIKIPYAGNMYPDPTGELSMSDLGQMKWDKFIAALNQVVMKYYASMESGTYMAVLMGDVRRSGNFYSMFTDIVKPGKIEQVIIKVQNNCSSMGTIYKKRNIVPIFHEYVMVLKKIMPYIVDFSLPKKYEVDIRDSSSSTWLDVVYAVMKDLHKASLAEIYAKVEGHRKTKDNPNWQAKIRQTLQRGSMFISLERGVWQIA